MIKIASWPHKRHRECYSPDSIDVTDKDTYQKNRFVERGLLATGLFERCMFDDIPQGSRYVVVLTYYCDLWPIEADKPNDWGIIFKSNVKQRAGLPDTSGDMPMCERLRADSAAGLVHWLIAHPTEVIKWDYINWSKLVEKLHVPSGNSITIAGGNVVNSELQSFADFYGVNVVSLNLLKNFLPKMENGEAEQYASDKLNAIYSLKTNTYNALCYNRLLREHRYATLAHIAQSSMQNTLFSSLRMTAPDHPVPWTTVRDNVLKNPNFFYLTKGSDWLTAHKDKDFRVLDEDVDLQQNQACSLPWSHGLNSNFMLVTETFEFQYGTFITEKSYKPFLFLQPFVQVGDHLNVQWLRDNGYDVFDDIVDHSYDQEPDWSKRVALALAEYTRLSSWNGEQWAVTLRNIAPRLLRNFQTAKTGAAVSGMEDLIDVLLRWQYQ